MQKKTWKPKPQNDVTPPKAELTQAHDIERNMEYLQYRALSGLDIQLQL